MRLENYVHALSDPPRYPADFGARLHHSGDDFLVNYDVFPGKKISDTVYVNWTGRLRYQILLRFRYGFCWSRQFHFLFDHGRWRWHFDSLLDHGRHSDRFFYERRHLSKTLRSVFAFHFQLLLLWRFWQLTLLLNLMHKKYPSDISIYRYIPSFTWFTLTWIVFSM